MNTLEKNTIISRFSYLNKKLDVLQTSHNDFSIVASSKINKGESVAVWGGKIVQKDDLTQMLNSTSLQISEDLFIVTPIYDDGRDSIHYIKHSQSPNCGFNGQIALVAMRDIESGEEITYDPIMNQSIERSQSLSPYIKEKYNGYFSTYIQKNIQSSNVDHSQTKFQNGAWGLLTSIDLEKCNPKLIRDALSIKRYVYELCDLIEMKRFGECHVVHFGEDERVAGFSMFQLIETSCISAHFANESNTAYLDIFSCKAYDPQVVAQFTQTFFKGGKYRMNAVNRF